MIIEFDQLVVNASEGNAAVICASARFNNEFPFDFVFTADVSAIPGTAGAENLSCPSNSIPPYGTVL